MGLGLGLPIHLDMSDEAEMLRKVEDESVAMAWARQVGCMGLQVGCQGRGWGRQAGCMGLDAGSGRGAAGGGACGSRL